MALVPATITVSFTSNYLGDHRVCYRIGSSGSYTCQTVNCLTPGGSCSSIINIFVDDETCEDVLYTGYVQASCLPESSTQDRLAWTYSFVPSPTCKSYIATCSSLGIASITMIDGGQGYTSPPTVSFTGSGDATATAVVGTGGLYDPIIVNAGSGYTNGEFTGVDITGGSGSGAVADVLVEGEIVTSIIITTPGTGYLAGGESSLGLDTADMGVPSIQAVFSASSDKNEVTAIIDIINSQPFVVIPTVVLTGGGGSLAQAEAVMEDCPAIVVTGCTGADVTVPAGALTGFGATLTLCGYSTPSVDSAYQIALTGNCVCNCVTATIGIDADDVGDQVRYFYTKCGLEERTGLLTFGGSPSQIIDCIVPGSLTFQLIDPPAVGTVTYGSNCP